MSQPFIPQLLMCFGVALPFVMSGVYVKHVRLLFQEAAAIPQRALAGLMQALVVAVGLAILLADCYTLHSVEGFIEELVRSMAMPAVGAPAA